MAAICNNCKGELTSENYPGSVCPHCGKPVVRDITMSAEYGDFRLTGREANFKITSYPEGLLLEAQDLKRREQFTLAIVIAAMACEISIDRAISTAFAARKVKYLEEAVRNILPSLNITNDRVRKLYTALTNDNIQMQPFWRDLTDLSKLRNAAVHNGKLCTKTEAETSLEVASQLVEHLKNGSKS